MSNGPPFVSPMKAMPRFSRRRRACVRSSPAVRLALIAATGWPSSSRSVSVPSSWPTKLMWTVAPDEDPWLVGPGEEDVAGLLDPLEDAPVRAAADALRREQAGPPRPAGCDLRPRLLVPVAARGRLVPGTRPSKTRTERLDVVVAEAAPQQLAAQERRVPDDELGRRPLGLARASPGRRGRAARRGSRCGGAAAGSGRGGSRGRGGSSTGSRRSRWSPGRARRRRR